MSDSFIVKSGFHDYGVEFVGDFSACVGQLASGNAFFVVDEKVFLLYRNRMNVPQERLFLVEAAEKNKTLEHAASLIKRLLEGGIRKNNTVVAVGGGVVQDITAFACSIMFRGLGWVFIPTTLLAQADSCVGGKTSINFGGYKNILGNFYPPSRILVDVAFLESLSAEDIKSGIGEMLHFYFIAGSPCADGIAQEYEKLFDGHKRLAAYIKESLMIKKQVIERDEFDQGERNLFNYGHTFGHAIEAVTDYAIAHGQAVTLGMEIANYISLQRGLLDESLFEQMHRILAKNMPAFEINEQNVTGYMKALARDKKNIGNDLTCILTQGPGRMIKTRLPLDEKLGQTILSYFNQRYQKVM